jgi:cytochrome b involved in lipid metabolism
MTLRDIFLWTTGLFWIGVGYYAVRCDCQAPAGKTAATLSRPSAATDARPQAPRIVRKPDLPAVSAADLARHATPDDCWIEIAGTVYDLSGYVDLHPSKEQEMEGYCGKAGTRAWDVKDNGKDRGKPHTKRAAEFLEEYPQVGVLKQ